MKLLTRLLWLFALGALLYGALGGGWRFVWSRGAALCLSCMGLQ